MPQNRTAPFRPRNDNNGISQPYSDGVVRIYNLIDRAAPGRKPQPELEFVATLCYAEKKLGISRYYAARQNQIELKRVLRVPKLSGINTQQIAVCEDGQQYRIDLVQLAEGVYPASYDLTLAEVEQIFKEGAYD